MAAETFSIGVDLGGTNIKFCAVDENGAIRAWHSVRTPTETGCNGIVDTIVANVPVVIERATSELAQIESIGLGVPGTVDAEAGVIVFAPNIFAVNFPAVKAIQAHYDLPVYLSQDSQAAAWAEYMVGAGKGLTNIVSVTLGTGIGCGMVMNGAIYRGSLNHTAGELAHQIVEIDGNECNCGRRGCLEAYAGGLAIVRSAVESMPELGELTGKSAQQVSVKDVFELALQGHIQAKRIVGDVVKYVGIGLVNLANLLSPDLISLSGGISEAPAELLFDPLVEFVRGRAYATIADSIRICRSSLGGDAPLIGVAILHKQPAALAAHHLH